MKLAARLSRLLPLALACNLGTASANESTPLPGTYTRKGGGGDLVVRPNGEFRITTLGGKGDTCRLDGTIVGGRATLADSACVVAFTPIGVRVTVAPPNADACRGFCGEWAWFGGDYLRRTSTCTDKAIAASRNAFKRAYDRKDYGLAQATLAPMLEDCDALLTGVHKGWLRNDLALAQWRSGDAAACRQTLAPLADEAGKSDPELRKTYSPVDAQQVLPMIRAARTNLRLCR